MSIEEYQNKFENILSDNLSTLLSSISDVDTSNYYRYKWHSVFKDDKWHKNEKTKRLNFRKLCADIGIENQRGFSDIVKIFSQDEAVKVQKIDAAILSKEFILTYLHLNQNTSYNQENLKKTIEIISNLLFTNKYDLKEYFSPLYGFDCEQQSLVIDDSFSIVRISSDKFDRISDLGISTEEEDAISKYEFKKIIFVLKMSFNSDHPNALKPIELAKIVLSSLRLVSNEFVALGSFYPFEPSGWCRDQDHRPRLTAHEDPPTPHVGYALKIHSIPVFLGLFKSLMQLNKLPEDRTRYFRYALRRFENTYGPQMVEDKITDLVISIETLLNNKPGEISFTVSLRAAILLTDNEEEREYIKKFLKKCYDIRSEIVHGKKRKEKILKNGIQLTDLEIVTELGSYGRTALTRMLQLQINFESQDDILLLLDSILVNRNKQSEISKFFVKY